MKDDNMKLKEAIAHCVDIFKRTFESKEDYYNHVRLMTYLTALDRIRNGHDRTVSLSEVNEQDLRDDITTLERSLAYECFSCEACRSDHLDLLRWMKELLTIME